MVWALCVGDVVGKGSGLDWSGRWGTELVVDGNFGPGFSRWESLLPRWF